MDQGLMIESSVPHGHPMGQARRGIIAWQNRMPALDLERKLIDYRCLSRTVEMKPARAYRTV